MAKPKSNLDEEQIIHKVLKDREQTNSVYSAPLQENAVNRTDATGRRMNLP